MPLKPLDFAVIIPAFVVVVFSFVVVYAGGGGRVTVNLRAENGRWVFPMDTEETVVVSGPLGETVIKISDNAAWVVSSPCPDRTCVAAGPVRLSGQWTACLPNRVMLYVSEGGNDGGVDATAW